MKSYRLLSSTSVGYRLYDMEDGSISLHKKRGIVNNASFLLVGDIVTLDKDGFIDNVLPRTNFLARPRLSNADIVLVLISLKEPDFNTYLLDKFLTMTNFYRLKSAIVLTKCDMLNKREKTTIEKRMEDYKRIGYSVYFVSNKEKDKYDFATLLEDLKGKSVALMGQTGVGKSSLINTIDSDFKRKIDDLRISMGRGRHTTKEVILLPYTNGFLFDTPGFSSLDLEKMKPSDLAICFPGYENYVEKCYFNDCLHLESTKGCVIKEEIEKGILSKDSYMNYLKIYEEVKANDVWKKKKDF